MNQAIGNERILNENLAALEMSNSKLKSEVDRLNQLGTREYETLAIEAQRLQSEIAALSGQEQVLNTKLASLEIANSQLNEELMSSKRA